MESRNKNVLPVFFSSVHETIIFMLGPIEGLDLDNGHCVLICVRINPAAWLE